MAVVTAPDRLLLIAVDSSAGAILSKLGQYVRANALQKLWPADAADAERFLDRREERQAVNLYFSRVGERWDPEFLHREVVVTRPDQP